MRKLILKFLLPINLLIVGMLPCKDALAQDPTDIGYASYILVTDNDPEKEYAILVRYDNSELMETEITIPNEVESEDYPERIFKVVQIGNKDDWDGVFMYNEAIEKVHLPEGLQRIEQRAFYMLPNLKSITIPDNVSYIGFDAFCYCLNLSEITFPTNLQVIPEMCFDHCVALESVVIPAGITNIGGGAFGYTNLSEITMLGTVPPVLGGADVFSSKSEGIMVYVPSGSLSTYENELSWQELRNFDNISFVESGSTSATESVACETISCKSVGQTLEVSASPLLNSSIEIYNCWGKKLAECISGNIAVRLPHGVYIVKTADSVLKVIH